MKKGRSFSSSSSNFAADREDGRPSVVGQME